LPQHPCAQARENLVRLHYADMLRDLSDALARIAAHVAIPPPPEVMTTIVEAATFASMKSNAARFTPGAGPGYWKADAGFFDSASSNRWEGRLAADDLLAYDTRIVALLTPAERSWLEWGSRGQGSRGFVQ